MLFAILFIISFLGGLFIYWYKRQWVVAVLIPMGLFLVTTLLDESARNAWVFTLIFGLPIVFFGSLLGAYILQTKSFDIVEDDVEKSDN